ncbi:MAG: sugar transferase, partial [Planctomycetota bacterium]
MDLSRVWTCFKVFVPSSRASILSNIKPQRGFHTTILSERARADRNQHSFSLLLFNIVNPEANSVGVQYLAQVIANRIRLTDEVGWFDNERIGVLLPHTSTAGARILADDVCQAIAARASLPEYTVYTYPSKWFSNGNGHQAQLHFEDLSPEQNTTTSRGLSTPARYADGTNNMFGVQLPSIDTTLSSRALSQAIEPFFLRPLPAWKRAMDVVCALFGLIVLSPILLLVAVVIKIVSPGPVFFKQHRVGYRGKTFAMLKFRTMHSDTDISTHKNHVKRLINGANNGHSNHPMTKLDNHPKIILFGRIL